MCANILLVGGRASLVARPILVSLVHVAGRGGRNTSTMAMMIMIIESQPGRRLLTNSRPHTIAPAQTGSSGCHAQTAQPVHQ